MKHITIEFQKKVTNKSSEFTQLIQKNQGIIHKVCKIYTDTTEAHEDLFQEIVLQLWKSFDSFKGDSKFSTWMYRVGLNTAITLIRKKTKSVDYTSLEEFHFNFKDNHNDEQTEHQFNLMYSAIKHLNDIERGLVLLYLEDMSYREIAETMGITEVNARVKMNRIKLKLKEIVSKLE